MKKRLLTITITLAVFLSGCAYSRDAANESYVPITEKPETNISYKTDTDITESFFIDSNTAATLPEQNDTPHKLSAPSGVHYGIYGDIESSEYMDYYLFVPENPTEQMPLIIFLHGDGEVGMSYMLETEGLIVSARKVYGENYPFLILQPCTRYKSWSDYGIPKILKKLINNIIDTYSIDPNKIIITGHSRGAIGVWNMINTYGPFFSAAVPVSGAAYIPLNYDNCTQVPIRCFTGDTWVEMQYYDVEIIDVESVNNAGGTAEIFILEKTDHGRSYETAYTEETFQWMLSQ